MNIIIGADLHDKGAYPVMRGTSHIVALKKEILQKFAKGRQYWPNALPVCLGFPLKRT